MRRRDFHWSLYHTTEKNQLDNLRTDQVEVVYAALPKALRKDWFIWKDGFDGWKPFDEFPDILVSLREASVMKVPTPTPPQQGPQGAQPKTKETTQPGKTVTDVPKVMLSPSGKPIREKVVADSANEQTMDFGLMEGGVTEDRAHERFDRKFEIRIVAGDKVYNNSTLNVSLKGIQLKDDLPPNLPKYFNVEIRKANRMIPVVGSEVKNKDGSPSKRILIEANEYVNALFSLLLEGN